MRNRWSFGGNYLSIHKTRRTTLEAALRYERRFCPPPPYDTLVEDWGLIEDGGPTGVCVATACAGHVPVVDPDWCESEHARRKYPDFARAFPRGSVRWSAEHGVEPDAPVYVEVDAWGSVTRYYHPSPRRPDDADAV